VYVASCKPFDFGAYPDDEPDSGILNGIITRRDRVNSMNFCGSAGSAAVRSLRLILICYSTHLCEMRGRKDSTSPKSLKKLSFFVLRKSLSLIPSSVATRFFISDILIAHFTLSLTYLLTYLLLLLLLLLQILILLRPVATFRHEEAVASSFLVV